MRYTQNELAVIVLSAAYIAVSLFYILFVFLRFPMMLLNFSFMINTMILPIVILIGAINGVNKHPWIMVVAAGIIGLRSITFFNMFLQISMHDYHITYFTILRILPHVFSISAMIAFMLMVAFKKINGLLLYILGASYALAVIVEFFVYVIQEIPLLTMPAFHLTYLALGLVIIPLFPVGIIVFVAATLKRDLYVEASHDYA